MSSKKRGWRVYFLQDGKLKKETYKRKKKKQWGDAAGKKSHRMQSACIRRTRKGQRRVQGGVAKLVGEDEESERHEAH